MIILLYSYIKNKYKYNKYKTNKYKRKKNIVLEEHNKCKFLPNIFKIH